MNRYNTPSHFRNTKSRSAEQSFIVAEEIIEDILSRLSVKSLLKLRCVSKSWRSLIGSKRFIETHFQNSAKNTSLTHHRVIFNSNNRVMKQCSLRSLLNEPSIDPLSRIDNPTTTNQSKTRRVVGCCNGLFCFLNFSGCFFLWNPAIRIFTELPKIDNVATNVAPKCGFGWDKTTDAYKVFVVVSEHYPNDLIGKVYSTKTNLWKTVEHGNLPWCGEAGQHACGKIHWLMSRGQYVQCWDLETEEFSRIELPFDDVKVGWTQPWLGEIGGCLRLMYDYGTGYIDIWIMKEYGVKESWLKVVTLPLVSVPRLFPLAPLLERGPNREIWLIYRGTFSVYFPKYDTFLAAKNMISFYAANVYVESLVSPIRMLEQCVVEGGDSG